jgi:transketolase
MTERLADHAGRLLAELAVDDASLWALDGDLADSDGAIHFAERHPQRFLMAGIAEQNMISMAAGMAEAGLRPFVFSFAAFLCYRAYDQIRVCVSQCRQPVTLVGSHAGGLGGRNGKSHAALNDLALMLSLPNLRVWSPADVPDVEFAVRAIVAERAPAYLRLPRRAVERAHDLPGAAAECRWLTPPRPVALVSTGLATHWALAAARALAARDVSVGVLHALRLTPPEALAAAAAPLRRAVVVEDHYAFGGLASLLQQAAPAARVTAIGWPAGWSGQSGGDEALLEAGGLSTARLVETVTRHLAADP